MKTVAVFFGGRSTEHDISVVTAIASIIKPLKTLGEYDIQPVYIAKDGAWYWDPKLQNIELYSSDGIHEYLRTAKPIALQFDGGLSLVKTTGLTGRKVTKKIDIAFPAMHGTNGEDGALMGLLEMANIPYVGCDIESSAIAMNKVLAKRVTTQAGVPTNDWKAVTKNSFMTKPSETLTECEKLGYPLFVKPVHQGSSIGINRASTKAELQNALEVAFHYDDEAIVEVEVPHLLELTLPIMGNSVLRPAFLERPLTKPGDFFDFETKYINGGKKGGGKKMGAKRGAQGYSEVPAQIPEKLYKKAESVACDAYKAMGCQGIARIDLLVNEETGEVYFNEANPLPGSLYQHNWRAAGVSPADLVKQLIHLAEDRFAEKAASTTSFSTNFLKQF